MPGPALDASPLSLLKLTATTAPSLLSRFVPQVISLSHEVFWLAGPPSPYPSPPSSPSPSPSPPSSCPSHPNPSPRPQSFETDASLRLTEKVWRSRIEHDSGVCYVALADCVPPTSPPLHAGGSSASCRPVGYVFAHLARHHHPTTTSSSSPSPFPPFTVHIWLSGVDPSFRRRKVMSRLMSLLTEDVRLGKFGRKDVRTLSVRTIPSRFGGMVGWLERDGWERVDEADENDPERVAYRKTVV